MYGMNITQRSHFSEQEMENLNQDDSPQVGAHLKLLVRMASFGGLFFSLSGTGVICAGTESFHCSPNIWKASLAFNFFIFSLTWITYLPFRHTDRLLGNGLLGVLMLFSMFWMTGLSTIYFYFLFSPINNQIKTIALTGITAALLHRSYLIKSDINEAFKKNKSLLRQMYCDEGSSITFRREATALLEKARRDRNPFKSYHLYAALIASPFVLSLNKVLTPILGDGHGVFLVSAFFSFPLLLWGVGIFVQTVMTMVYYPIKLERETGKPVLLKDW